MKRRDFFRFLSATGAFTLCGCSIWPFAYFRRAPKNSDAESTVDDMGEVKAVESQPAPAPNKLSKEILEDVRTKSAYFSQDFPDDIYFRDRKLELVREVVQKLRAAQKYVGHGNFNLLGIDEFFRISKYGAGMSEVTNEEKLFMEELFYFDAKKYGFFGGKVFQKMTDVVHAKDVAKIPYTGHFLRKGKPIEIYESIRRDVGESLLLTSGVRAVAKQFHLFLEKALETNGNMSKASRSIAPPGYSFHGLGDFDIGKIGFGLKNFTSDFAATDEFQRLLELGYVEIRYTERNELGVRFEPWHIKVPV